MNDTPVFSPKPSKISFIYLILVHIFSMICIFLLIPFWMVFLCLPMMLIFFIYFIRYSNEIVTLQYAKKTEWILGLKNGKYLRGELLKNSVIFRYFLILHFKIENKTKTIVIWSDSLSLKEYKAVRRAVRRG